MEIVMVAKKKGIGDCGLENLPERLLLKYPTGESRRRRRRRRRRRLSPEKHQSYDHHQAIVVGILSTAAVGVLQFSQKKVVPLHHPPPSQAHTSHKKSTPEEGLQRRELQHKDLLLPSLYKIQKRGFYMEEPKLKSEAVGQETQNPHTRERLHHVLLLPLFLLSQCITSSPLHTQPIPIIWEEKRESTRDGFFSHTQEEEETRSNKQQESFFCHRRRRY
jgi:hypothetical protein